MAMLRWDPWGELAALQRDVSELFNRTQAAPPARAAAGGLVPPIDAYRTDEALIVRIELPGLTPDEVDVAVDDGLLTISGERQLDADIPEDAWVRRERPVGAFERSFNLPEGTDPSGIDASFANGLLELRIPHPPERRPHKVRVSGGGEQSAVGVGGS